MSLRTFPSPRAVERHALEATENAARWVQSTITRAGVMEPELPFLVTRVLAHVFGTSRAEIRKRLNARVEGLRAFIGGGEEVQLGRRGDGMTAETKELLYSELQKRYRTIAAVGRQELVTISARVLSRALKTEELRELGRTVVHRTWPSFEPLLRSYLALFVEVKDAVIPILNGPESGEFKTTSGKELLDLSDFDRSAAVEPLFCVKSHHVTMPPFYLARRLHLARNTKFPTSVPA